MAKRKLQLKDYVAIKGRQHLAQLITSFPEMKGRVILVDACAEPDPKKREEMVAQFLKTSAELTKKRKFFKGKIKKFKNQIHKRPSTLNRYRAYSWKPEKSLFSFADQSKLTRHAIIAPDLDVIRRTVQIHGWLDARRYKQLHNAKDVLNISHINIHLTRVLDHEFAHTVTHAMGVKLTKRQHEITADVFSALRHIQKYGTKTPFLRDMVDRRAMGLLYGDFDHYTVDALLRVNKLTQTNDLKKYTPRQLLLIAHKIAKTSKSVPAADQKKIAKVFSQFGNRPIHAQGKKIVAAMLKTHKETDQFFVKHGIKYILNAVARDCSYAPDALKKMYQRPRKSVTPKTVQK